MTLSLADRSNKAQKVKVLPIAGKDPDAQRSEMIKVVLCYGVLSLLLPSFHSFYALMLYFGHQERHISIFLLNNTDVSIVAGR